MREIKHYKVIPKTIGLCLLLVFLAACGRPTATITPSSVPSPRPPTALPTVATKPTIVPPSPSVGRPTVQPTLTPTPIPTSVILESLPPAPLAWLDEQGALWYAGPDGVPNRLADRVHYYVWSPNGSQIGLLRDGNLWLLDIAGTMEPRLLLDSGRLIEIEWSPTGERIAGIEKLAGESECIFPDSPPTRIVIADIPNGTVRVLFDGPHPKAGADSVGSIQWSPDGRSLYAMGCYAVTSMVLLSIAVEDESVQVVTGMAWCYAVLPNRGTVLVREHRYIDTGSHRVAAEYSPEGALLQEWPELENMLFSPGPKGTIAFTEEPIYPNEVTGTLYLRRPDGTVFQTALDLDEDTRWSGPILDWSPDGNWLAVERTGEIWLVNALTGEAHPLVDGRWPRWQPQPPLP